MFNGELAQGKAVSDNRFVMTETRAKTSLPFEQARLIMWNGISSFPVDAIRSVILAVSIVLFVSISGQAQGKENNNWFFGNGAGLTFNTTSGAPTTLLGGKLTTLEGCASISDKNGNVLFYTDGTTVWNKKNQLMTAGTGLMGNISATQSAIIVPWPGTRCQKYFIFTVDAAENNLAKGLRYSVVDFTNDPLGAVGTKNVLLKYPVAEKLTAVSDGDGGFWVIAHGYNIANSVAGNNEFYAYHITIGGLLAAPKSSAIGSNHGGGSPAFGPAVGYLKVSPDGKRLACASWMGDFVEVFNFDIATGSVTALVRKISATEFPNSHPYGIEFSPDGSRLYVSTNRGFPNKLLQFDLKSTSVAAELDSTSPVSPFYDFGALQLGPDGKIYVARNKKTQLSVINFPNALGASACSYSINGPSLPQGSNCEIGLPCVIQGDFSCESVEIVDLVDHTFHPLCSIVASGSSVCCLGRDTKGNSIYAFSIFATFSPTRGCSFSVTSPAAAILSYALTSQSSGLSLVTGTFAAPLPVQSPFTITLQCKTGKVLGCSASVTLTLPQPCGGIS